MSQLINHFASCMVYIMAHCSSFLSSDPLMANNVLAACIQCKLPFVGVRPWPHTFHTLQLLCATVLHLPFSVPYVWSTWCFVPFLRPHRPKWLTSFSKPHKSESNPHTSKWFERFESWRSKLFFFNLGCLLITGSAGSVFGYLDYRRSPL